MQADKQRSLEMRATQMRRKALEMIRTANSGHIGGSFSIAEIVSTLYFDTLNIDPQNPKGEERDRFILSKGHCSPIVYAALAMRGYFPEQDLSGFRSIDSYLSGHIEMKKVPGVDMSAGSLGQGLSVACGMALCAKVDGKAFHTYCITGDGEMQEGQIWEALMAAGNLGLSNLTLIVDNNGIQLDGTVDEIMPLAPLNKKLEAFGWHVLTVDGHDVAALADAFAAARAETAKPTAIIAKTVKGKGVSVFEGQVRFHGGRPTAEEWDIAFAQLDQKLAGLEA